MRFGAKKVASSSNAVRKNVENDASPPRSNIHRPGSEARRAVDRQSWTRRRTCDPFSLPSVPRIRRLFTPIQVSNARHPGEELYLFFCYKRLFLTKGHAAVLKKNTQKKKKLWSSYDLSLCHSSLSSICSWDADVQPRYLTPRSLLPSRPWWTCWSCGSCSDPRLAPWLSSWCRAASRPSASPLADTSSTGRTAEGQKGGTVCMRKCCQGRRRKRRWQGFRGLSLESISLSS